MSVKVECKNGLGYLKVKIQGEIIFLVAVISGKGMAGKGREVVESFLLSG
jgi:hypothetical protein